MPQEKHILVIDDETITRDLIRVCLESDGHHVSTAASGEEGLRMFREQNCDLVMTDQSMPGMNGNQVAEGIKKLNGNMPVVLLSGYGDAMVTGERSACIDMVIGKPVMRENLRAIMAKIFGAQPAP